MNEQEEGLEGRLVVGSKPDGWRKYDENAKRELIQACLEPGVSIARTAMDHRYQSEPRAGLDFAVSARAGPDRSCRARE
jgi:hypothetical protein